MTLPDEHHFNYQRIAEAIRYIAANHTRQPRLGEMAELSHLSPYHYQRLFTEWVGVSPKKFMQFLSVSHARKVLRSSEATLFQTAHEMGLSGTGRLHDLFVGIEAMTPGEFKRQGAGLEISYDFATSQFGEVIIASTSKGICYVAFIKDEEEGVNGLMDRFPRAQLIQKNTAHQQSVGKFFQEGLKLHQPIHLHLSGTPFQLKVWEALLRIPAGNLATYKAIATAVDKPSASRAVGTAIGANPVAFLIPCHRVIQATGQFGGYMWGSERKQILLGWEAAKYRDHVDA